MRVPLMIRTSICRTRERLVGFDAAHRWRTVFYAGADREVYDAVVCATCGANGWRNR